MELEQFIVTVGLAGALVGGGLWYASAWRSATKPSRLAGALVGGGLWYGRATFSEKRLEATRQVLLLRLPKEDENFYKELLHLSDTYEKIDDALSKANERSFDLALKRRSAAIKARREKARTENGGLS